MYRILLVDDEWLELDTLEKYIPWEEMGFQVAGTAENGKEALQLLERLEGSENEGENDRKLPDVVLTDVKMPVMDGLEATRKIKAVNPTLPVIAVTAYAYDHDREKALQAGCNDYMTKPMDVTELKQKLSEFVKDKH